MRRSSIPITYSPKDGVNLEPGTPVIFIPGPNAHGVHSEAELLGVYQEYRVLEKATRLRIIRQGKRFSPVINQVFRLYDARDEEIERLRQCVDALQMSQAYEVERTL
jgi:hypothetical protein